MRTRAPPVTFHLDEKLDTDTHVGSRGMHVMSSPCAGDIDDTMFEEADQPHDMISRRAGTSVSSLLASRLRQDSVPRFPQPARTTLLPSRVSEWVVGPAEALPPGICRRALVGVNWCSSSSEGLTSERACKVKNSCWCGRRHRDPDGTLEIRVYEAWRRASELRRLGGSAIRIDSL